MATIRELKINKNQMRIEWEIGDFFSLSDKVNDFIESDAFSFGGTMWCIKIYPNGCSKVTVNKVMSNTEGYVGVFLRRLYPGSPIELNYSLCLKTVEKRANPEMKIFWIFADTVGRGSPNSITRSSLLKRKAELTPPDTLTVICEMTLLKATKVASGTGTAQCSSCQKSVGAESLSSHEAKGLQKLKKCPECSEIILLQDRYEHKCKKSKDEEKNLCTSEASSILCKTLQRYKKLYLEKKDCDVVIRVKGQEFPAHRIILAAHSSVFESTFRNDMKEKSTGIIDIEDCDPSSFSDFLCFLYCAEIATISSENVLSLFITADKYDVQDLRAKCCDFILKNLSVDNFCDTITLALQFSEAELIKTATDFFAKNLQKIIVTVKWQMFLAENPTQSNELLIKALVHNN